MPNHKSEDEIVTGSGSAALPPAKPLTTSQLLALLEYTCQELEQERAARKTAENKSAELKEEIRLMVEAQRCSQDEPRFGGFKTPMDSKKNTVTTSQNIKDKMDAVNLLADDFLSLMWSEKGKDYSALKARFERHCSALEAAGPLPSAFVLTLFAKLEERAIYEINTCALLAQSHDPDGIASQRLNVPAIVLSNIHILHQYLPKIAQSDQAKKAAKAPRPRGRHPDRQRVIHELKKRIKSDPNYPYAYGQRASFIKEMLSNHPNVERPNTIRDWMNEYLKNDLGRLTP